MTQTQHLARLGPLGLLFAAIPPLLSAQEAPAPQSAAKPDDKPTHSLKTPGREVQLAVTVRDKKGALVPSLRQERLHPH